MAVALSALPLEAVAKIYVGPYYLDMMRINAVRASEELLGELTLLGRSIDTDDVLRLLRCGAWREGVMGAWYAVQVRGPEVTAAVLQALRNSHGSLNAPPLATAAVVLAGPEAIDALEEYFIADQAQQWGAAGLTAAAADYLREHAQAGNPLPRPTPVDTVMFGQLIEIAQRLQHD